MCVFCFALCSAMQLPHSSYVATIGKTANFPPRPTEIWPMRDVLQKDLLLGEGLSTQQDEGNARRSRARCRQGHLVLR